MTSDQWLMALAAWLAFGTLCGFLAPLKGRNSPRWFLAGFLFGPLALIALGFVERHDPAEEARTCQHCRARVEPDQWRCTTCGRAMVCQACHRRVERGRERFCDRCGADLPVRMAMN